MTPRLFDISQRLSPGLPIWPGDTPFQVEPVWTHGEGCPVNVARLSMSPHSGSHADAPLHYDPEGIGIADVALDPYLGPCQVVDLSDHSGPVEPDHLAHRLPARVERLLLRTFASFPHEVWVEDFTPIAPATIHMLAERGVKLVGTDAPSLDPQHSKSMTAHLAVKATGMRVLEGLVLDAVPEGEYELIALPLKLQGVDASPVRAILRDLRP
jgi:arylformamidase